MHFTRFFIHRVCILRYIMVFINVTYVSRYVFKCLSFNFNRYVNRKILSFFVLFESCFYFLLVLFP